MKALMIVKISHKLNSDKVTTGTLENINMNNPTLNGSGDIIASTAKT